MSYNLRYRSGVKNVGAGFSYSTPPVDHEDDTRNRVMSRRAILIVCLICLLLLAIVLFCCFWWGVYVSENCDDGNECTMDLKQRGSCMNRPFAKRTRNCTNECFDSELVYTNCDINGGCQPYEGTWEREACLGNCDYSAMSPVCPTVEDAGLPVTECFVACSPTNVCTFHCVFPQAVAHAVDPSIIDGNFYSQICEDVVNATSTNGCLDTPNAFLDPPSLALTCIYQYKCAQHTIPVTSPTPAPPTPAPAPTPGV